MVVLFVHGMGRSPVSGWPMLRLLRRAGMTTGTFAYAAAFEDFAAIKSRLVKRIVALAAADSYIVVGHSLGGVLLRAALRSLPAAATRPRHVFLLGSPVQASCLAARLKQNCLYRLLAGDCGQLLSSPERMREIGSLTEATTSIVGVRDMVVTRRFFAGNKNDGIISVSEAGATWIACQLQLPIIHTLLPSSRQVARIIADRMAESAGSQAPGQ